MARLSAHLHFFIRKQQTHDAAWQRMTVILSGHEVPGEGEHKIMEHIRWARAQPTYAPNQRHCLYGLDADLIMLALVTHEPHFCLLREVVKFGGGGAGQPSREVLENPSEESFQLLQIGLLRDYFDAEFKPIPPGFDASQGTAKLPPKAVLPFGYDLERVIDDIVFLAMLVGNDFLPPLPTLDIAEGALNNLFDIYRQELPTLGGYLTHEGSFDAARAERVLARLALLEGDVLLERAKNAEEHAEKKGRRDQRDARKNGGAAPRRAQRVTELDEDDQFDAELAEVQSAAAVEEAPGPDPSMMRPEKRAFFLTQGGGGLQRWKEVYYTEKLELDSVSEMGDAMRRLCFSYVEGLTWVLQYYYRGVASWGWFYPNHYAPMASDLSGQTLLDAVAAVSFTLGTPFTPFEQLLAVLPSASSQLLPATHRALMEAGSPIQDFYPLTFKIDFEGKRNDWEGIVQVPFIEEARLLAAARGVDLSRLSAAERGRNTPGSVFTFAHSPGFAEEYPSSLPRSFAALHPSRCQVSPSAAPPPLPPTVRGFGPWLVPGTRLGGASPPGFPTLRTIHASARLANSGCNVFGSASKKESLLVRVSDLGPEPPSAADVSDMLLGSRCFVSWPYLQEAMVVAVSDSTGRVATPGCVPGSRVFSRSESDEWTAEAARLGARYLTHQGLELGRVSLLVHVRACEGLVKHADGSLQKRFGGAEAPYPLQATLRKCPGGADPRSQERPACDASALPQHGPALFLGRSHFGALARVVEGPLGDGTYTVAVTAFPPDAGAAKRCFAGAQARFERSGQLARRLRLSPRLLGQLTGSVWVRVDEATRLDCGLNLKNAKQGLCVPDYCRPTQDEDGWEYSEQAGRLVGAYAQRCPWLFKALADDLDGPQGIDVKAALPGMPPSEAARHAYDAAAWLRKQPAGRRPLVKTAASCPPEEALRALVAATGVAPVPMAPVLLERVAPLLLLAPLQEREAASVLCGGDFELGDRVVFVGCSQGSAPPFGARGTVVGIHPWEVGTSLELLLDAGFEGGSDLHGRVPARRGSLLPAAVCLNLSHPPPLPELGAWAPPQRSRRAPPALPPIDGRLAWSGGAEGGGGGAPSGALAAAKAALSQLSALVPQAHASAEPASRAAGAAKALKRAPPPAPDGAAPAADALLMAKLTLGGLAEAPRSRAPAGSGAGGRGGGAAAGRQPSMPADSEGSFRYGAPQGRGRGRGAPPFVERESPPAPLAGPQGALANAQQLLALLHSGGAKPAPPPAAGADAGAAILSLIRGGAAAQKTTHAGAAILALVQGAAPAAPAPKAVDDAAAELWASLSAGGGGPASPVHQGGGNAGLNILRMVNAGQEWEH